MCDSSNLKLNLVHYSIACHILEPNNVVFLVSNLGSQIEIRNDDLGFDICTTLGSVDYRRSNITLSSRFSSISQSRTPALEGLDGLGFRVRSTSHAVRTNATAHWPVISSTHNIWS